MSKKDLETMVEALAGEVVMSDPHDLQAVSRMMEAFGKIAESAGDEFPLLRDMAKAALAMSEDMIVQEPDEATKSLNVLGEAVVAMQACINRGEKDAAELIPAALGLEADGQGSADAGAAPEEKPVAVDDDILAEFLSGQESVMDDLESKILEADKEGLNDDNRSAIKRIIHTLKGESGMLGLNEIQRLCHETETYVEAGGDDQIIDKLLAVKDWLNNTFQTYTAKGIVAVSASEVLKMFQDGVDEQEPAEKKAEPQQEQNKQAAAPESDEPAYEASGIFLEDADPSLLQDFLTEARGHLDNADVQLLTIENEPEDQEALNALFRSFHTIKGGAGFLDLSDISELSHVAEDLLDKARKGSLLLNGPVVDVVFESVDALRRLLDAVEKALTSGEAVEPDSELSLLHARLKLALTGQMTEDAPSSAPVHPDKRLGEILVESGRTSEEDVEKILSTKEGQAKLGEALVREGKVKASEVAGALRAQKQARNPKQEGARGKQEAVKVRETVKIDTDRLDKLLDVIGELVIAESIVSQDDEILVDASHRVTRNLRQLHKITRSVQELGMSMRMVAIRPTFQKMARLVRDLARKSGKKVEFVTNGEDTELDRSVVEKINDPLIHLVRNSLDHGIEDDPAKRVAAGKPEVAKVELRAFHRGGNIFIEIEDDGRGLNREAILEKAREKGVVEDGSELSDKEVFHLIFAPGFSTAKQITDVSGRGVGMDVVKRNIEALRGNIELISTPGKGTTVSMQLPLTLAIIEGLNILVGEERYIVPTLSVIESMRPTMRDINTVNNRSEMLKVRGALMPLYRISRIFDIPGAEEDPEKALVMIVESQGKQVALMVDKLLGQQQVVIKSLGRGMGKVQGISGGAIMPDGRVGLIMDISEVVKLAVRTGNGPRTAAPVVAEEEALAAQEA